MHTLSPDNTDPIPIADRWFTVDNAGSQWSVLKPRTIRNAIARGELRAARLGVGRRRIVIKGSWILEWLERCAEPQEIRRR